MAKAKKTQILPRRGKRGEAGDAPLQAGYGTKRQRRPRWQSEEPQAGHRHRPVESAKKGDRVPRKSRA